MKISFYILSILLFISCQQTETVDLTGHWSRGTYVAENKKLSDYQELSFKGNKVELMAGGLFKEKGFFNVEKDSICFQLKNGEKFQTELKIVGRDSIELFNNITYFKTPDSLYSETALDIEAYELAGWQTSNRLDTKLWYKVIHLFLDEQGEMWIRLNDKVVKDLTQLPIFLETHHASNNSRPLIFVGKGITLANLYEVYLHIYRFSSNRAYLVFSKNYIDGYHVFYDRFEIWADEHEQFLKDKNYPPMPPPPPSHYRDYYTKSDIENIVLNSVQDIEAIENLVSNKEYLISINKNLSIKSYSIIKEKLRQLRRERNIKYRTEIIE